MKWVGLASGGLVALRFEVTQSDSCPESEHRSSPMAILADRESQLLIDGKLVAGSGGTFADDQPGHRGGARRRRRCGRRHGPGDRRGPPRVRRHGLVDQRRVAGALHPPAATGDARSRRRTAGAHHRRGGCASDADVHGAARRPGRRPGLLCRHRRDLPVDHRPRQSRHRWASRRDGPSPGRPSVSSAPSPRGTSRTRSTSPRSARRWRRATPWCSSRRPTPRGAPRCSVS